MNSYEQAVFDNLTKRRGFRVLRNGWPDFLVLNKDETRGFALELKKGTDKLSSEQIEMHKALARFGILTFTAKDDFDVLLRKHGRILLVPADVARLQEQKRVMEETAWQVEALKARVDHEIEELKYAMDTLLVLFSESQTGPQPNVLEQKGQ